jgi:hypothetical protein
MPSCPEGIITPFVCTVSLGLLCSYVHSFRKPWFVIAAVGAVGNGLALTFAGCFVGWLLADDVLLKFYDLPPEKARYVMALSTGLIGAVTGSIVLAAFKRSERERKDIAKWLAGAQHVNIPELYAPSPAQDLATPLPFRPEAASQEIGGYSRSNVQEMEGCYICIRPAFTSPGVITSYLVVVRWDQAEACLVFEEQGRADAAHTQKGRVYIPDGRPFVNFVTVENGAIRVMIVSRPEKQVPARGLVMTLSNPAGADFTPASAPVVLLRMTSKAPQLGFVRPDSPHYNAYRNDLGMVMPAFGLFVSPPQPLALSGR